MSPVVAQTVLTRAGVDADFWRPCEWHHITRELAKERG